MSTQSLSAPDFVSGPDDQQAVAPTNIIDFAAAAERRAEDSVADDSVLTFADDAIEYAYLCETEAYDGHAEDMADPMHGTDLDPCAICAPQTFDLAVAALHDSMADLRALRVA